MKTLSNPTDLTLLLIGEELKSRKFFHVLREAGLDDCPYQPHLDTAITSLLGLDDNDDEVFSWYDDIMEKCSSHISPERKAVKRQAKKALMSLMARGKPERNKQ